MCVQGSVQVGVQRGVSRVCECRVSKGVCVSRGCPGVCPGRCDQEGVHPQDPEAHPDPEQDTPL